MSFAFLRSSVRSNKARFRKWRLQKPNCRSQMNLCFDEDAHNLPSISFSIILFIFDSGDVGL